MLKPRGLRTQTPAHMAAETRTIFYHIVDELANPSRPGTGRAPPLLIGSDALCGRRELR